MDFTYKRAGVDIKAGNEAVRRIKNLVRSTFNKNVLTDVGTFSALFSFEKKYKKPVLVSSSDGVGTKLKLAYSTNKHETVGQDLVNHCVNDILTTGASPLFFLDYIALNKMVPKTVEGIVRGFVKACKENNCSLLGGETAELPGLYKKNEYDIAGFVVGVVEKNNIINGRNIKAGDKIIGLASNGLHTNGYSLVYKVLGRKLNAKLKKELMKIHKSYLKPVQLLLKKYKVKGMAHITGSGFDNISRILQKNTNALIKKGSWKISPIFNLIQKRGNIAEKEMYKTFNMGIGYVLVVSKRDADGIVKVLIRNKVNSYEIGEIVKGNKRVIIK